MVDVPLRMADQCDRSVTVIRVAVTTLGQGARGREGGCAAGSVPADRGSSSAESLPKLRHDYPYNHGVTLFGQTGQI